MKEIIYEKLGMDKIPEIIEKTNKQCVIDFKSGYVIIEVG